MQRGRPNTNFALEFDQMLWQVSPRSRWWATAWFALERPRAPNLGSSASTWPVWGTANRDDVTCRRGVNSCRDVNLKWPRDDGDSWMGRAWAHDWPECRAPEGE